MQIRELQAKKRPKKAKTKEAKMIALIIIVPLVMRTLDVTF